MIRGLVIGKFLPPHQGHVALVYFAARQCDEVIVSLSDAPDDPIDPQLRLAWLKQLTASWKNVSVQSIIDNFDRPDLPLAQRTAIWADVITKRYGRVDKVFSSEDYGDAFATNLGAVHFMFDRERKLSPVSGSAIRQNPFRYWEYIPEVVRPFFVKKICFYGAESTGKSTMSVRMAQKYHTLAVPEVAREMITSNDFTADDIIRIGKAQTARVIEYTQRANKFLFCDTDVITTQIYSRHYLNVVPEILYDLEKQVVYDRYFFMDIDVPWVQDGLRDLGERRDEMRSVFLKELEKRRIDYVLVQGSFEERERIVERTLNAMMG